MQRLNDHNCNDTIHTHTHPSNLYLCQIRVPFICCSNNVSLVGEWQTNISLPLRRTKLNTQSYHWNWHWMDSYRLKLNYLLNALWNSTPRTEKKELQPKSRNKLSSNVSAEVEITECMHSHSFDAFEWREKTIRSNYNKWMHAWNFVRCQKECQILCHV